MGSGTIWKSYGSPKQTKNVTRLVLEAYGTHMEIHMEIIFPSLMSLTSIWNQMEVIWKSQTKKNVTRLVLEAYGTHMEIHMEIIFPCLMLLTSIRNHMKFIWKSYGSPKQKKCY